jgi:hypothetical protein
MRDDVAADQAQQPDPRTLPSLDLALELTREQFAIQRDYAKNIDSKASFVLTSASFLAAGTTVLNGLPSAGVYVPAVRIATLAIVLVFGYVGFATYQAFKIQDFETVPDPGGLRRGYLDKEVTYTKYQILDTMIESYEDNSKTLARKVKWTRRAARGLLLEIAVLLAMAVVLALPGIVEGGWFQWPISL